MPLYTSLLPQFGAIMLVFLINFVLSDKESDLFRDISSTIDPIAAWEADQNPFACYNGGEENPKMSQKFLEFFDSTQASHVSALNTRKRNLNCRKNCSNRLQKMI